MESGPPSQDRIRLVQAASGEGISKGSCDFANVREHDVMVCLEEAQNDVLPNCCARVSHRINEGQQ